MKKIQFSLLICIAVQLLIHPLAQAAQPQIETLTVAIIPHRSNLGNEQAYAPLFKELEKELGVSFEWVGSKTYDDVIRHVTTGQADIGYVGPFAYVDAQDNHGVRLICRTLSKKKVEFYHSMIITRYDSGINSLQDLKGKSISFTDPKSTSGFLFPMAELKKEGLRMGDFSEVRYLKRHANSLLAVHKAHVDAGATSYTAIDKVDIDFDDIKILWKSEPIYRGPWVAKKDLPDALFRKIQKAMLKANNSERAEEIFKGLTTKGFVAGKDSDYDNVREVVRLMQDQN